MSSVGPNTFAECDSLDMGVLKSLRSRLKKQNFHNFECLLSALQHREKVVKLLHL